ncbi:MAG TPA: plastocyanin/azurin family copper-binding protein [Verrucomicrobiae bacterium]|jgi:plastocyanin|nr:plastocyanin/azurin family copper-binding protein [Verrucomicrobiae bacterium]
MKRNLLLIVPILAAASVTCIAGTLEGKVSAGNSVVYVDTIAGKTFPAPSKTALISQRGLAFVPHLTVVQVGTTVDFQNDDSVQHNVFWPSVGGNKKDAHNMGTWPQGDKRSYKFDHPGVVPLLCNVHPEMSGYLIVSPTPYFAQTDAGGNFKIDNIPDGKYTVVAWHEGSKPVSKPVDVAGTGKVDFTSGK